MLVTHSQKKTQKRLTRIRNGWGALGDVAVTVQLKAKIFTVALHGSVPSARSLVHRIKKHIKMVGHKNVFLKKQAWDFAVVEDGGFWGVEGRGRESIIQGGGFCWQQQGGSLFEGWSLVAEALLCVHDGVDLFCGVRRAAGLDGVDEVWLVIGAFDLLGRGNSVAEVGVGDYRLCPNAGKEKVLRNGMYKNCTKEESPEIGI